MLVEIITKDRENKEDAEFVQIKFDGRQQFYVFDGDPTDNKLHKNFAQCFNIKYMLEKMYDAGLKSEPVEFRYISI